MCMCILVYLYAYVGRLKVQFSVLTLGSPIQDISYMVTLPYAHTLVTLMSPATCNDNKSFYLRVKL